MRSKVQRRRRSRTAHSGVKLKRRPSGVWVARWIDPLSGAETQQSLDAVGASTDEARRAWAIAKAQSLRKTAAAIASGGAVATRTTIGQAVHDYLAAATAKPVTLEGYKPALARMSEWAAQTGLRLTQDLQSRHLAAFRDHLTKQNAALPAASGRRGEKRVGKRRLSGVSVNKALTVVKLFLHWARRNGLAPHLDGDAIRDRLRPVKAERHAVHFLRPKQVQDLLKAALRHDAATFSLTREEHDGERPKGTTPRYVPAAPVVLLAVTSGMRLSELLGLRWDEVDLAAGEIRLGAGRTKTAAARTITLQETPTALALLGALRLRVPGDLVLPAWGIDLAKATRKRLVAEFGAPPFDWQSLRRTCAAVLTNSPAIFGSASAYRSAKRTGHSVVIAERYYVDVLRDLPKDATSIEAAIGIEDIATAIVEGVRGAVTTARVAK